MPPDSAALNAGQVIAACRVERLIGQGTTGQVYAVEDLQDGGWRALKLFTPPAGAAAGAAAEARERFEREATIAARLVHPDILRIHRSGQHDGRPWLLMDLLTGTDLSRYTQPARLLPEPVALGLAARIARALAHAHSQGVVHRDLKPANVMVDWATGQVTLTDFGLARTADAEATRTGLVLGSPAYMAPELMTGAPPTSASDLYALGVVLFQLLSGRLPFDASGLGELLRQVATVPAPDLRQIRPDLASADGPWSDRLAGLLAALLAKSPAGRPGDAAEVAGRLDALRAGPVGRQDGPKSRR